MGHDIVSIRVHTHKPSPDEFRGTVFLCGKFVVVNVNEPIVFYLNLV